MSCEPVAAAVAAMEITPSHGWDRIFGYIAIFHQAIEE
jgi:hypothetical protein